jgi:hypothetical protein
MPESGARVQDASRAAYYSFWMATRDLTFTPLERAVLAAICEMHPADRTALDAQLSTATPTGCENTGAGFHTRFSVDPSSSAPIRGVQLRNGPQAKIDGLKYGMGFILWLKEGYADCLEGYTYDDSTKDIALETIGFQVDPNVGPESNDKDNSTIN